MLLFDMYSNNRVALFVPNMSSPSVKPQRPSSACYTFPSLLRVPQVYSLQAALFPDRHSVPAALLHHVCHFPLCARAASKMCQ